MTRLPDPGFEPRVADWLESDPDHAPAAVLATVLAAFPSIPQRRAWRAPRRFQTMNRFALIGAAAAIVVAVGLGGVLFASRSTGPGGAPYPTLAPTSAPTATPMPSPSQSPNLTGMYTSPIYGYSIRVDPAWKITPAKVTADTPGATDDRLMDHLAITETDTTINVYANSLDGATFDAWLAQKHQEVLQDSTVPPSCKAVTPDSWPPTRVGNVSGKTMTLCNFAVVFAESGGKAYSFEWANETFAAGDHYSIADFLQVLQTVTFP